MGGWNSAVLLKLKRHTIRAQNERNILDSPLILNFKETAFKQFGTHPLKHIGCSNYKDKHQLSIILGSKSKEFSLEERMFGVTQTPRFSILTCISTELNAMVIMSTQNHIPLLSCTKPWSAKFTCRNSCNFNNKRHHD